MSNKMLIDASHPEETRVAVVRGNRIEEFDFESQEKKQLRGNIYLAKVTRVEPSLQAAFIDYGGNRHGFLAFSEIHPDYYQIPVADRQALLEAEAEEARAAREADDADDEQEIDVQASDGDDETEEPKKKPRRRRGRKPKAAAEAEADSEASEGETEEAKPADAENDDVAATDTSEAETEAEAQSDSEDAEVEEKPKRRTTRKRTTRKKATEPNEAETEPDTDASSDNGDDDDSAGSTMAAMVEMDSISEPLPGEDGDDEPEAEAETSEAADANEAPVEEEAPKPKRTRRKTKKQLEAEKQAAEEEAIETAAEDPDKIEAEASDENSDEQEASSEAKAEEVKKPKRRSRRRSRKKEDTSESAAEDENGEDGSDPSADVESVGQEDALEEVPAPRRLRRHYKIQEVVKRRQVLLVQVVKEERGTKGAALTTYLSLAGRYSVLMPNTARGGGISRKITNSSDRKRLKAIASELEVPNGMGVILRTAGASRTNAEIKRDFEYLMRLWEQVKNLTLSSSAPCLVYEEGSLIKRSIRDQYDKDTGEVVVAGEDGYNEAKDFMAMLMPSHAKKVKLHKGGQAIFAKYGVEAQLDKMVSPQVTLKSGGYLVINQTEALVAVDVNSGRATREHSVEDTALQTNLEAAEEVSRQLRLRDLAGLIVIDFIDMEERRNNRAVEKRLKDCLKNDRARIQVGRISHFGLMEMSRQRMRASVLESTMDICTHCAGTGYVRSDSAIALHVFRAIEEHLARHSRTDCIVKTTPSIAIHILNHKRAALLELENKYGLHIFVEGDPDIKGQEFAISKGDPATGEPAQNVVGFQNDAAFDAVDNNENDDEQTEGGKRKRNRRRKRKNSEVDAESDDALEANTEETEDQSEDGEGEQQKKKRRRGKRGGRKTKAGDEAATSENDADSEGTQAEAGAAEEQASPAPSSDQPSETDAVGDDAPEEDAKPKRRSTRRKKAPIATKPEATSDESLTEASDASEPTSEPDAKEEPPRPKRRRTTRRKPAEDTSVSASADADEADSSSEDGEKPKKSGWWQRGGGFF